MGCEVFVTRNWKNTMYEFISYGDKSSAKRGFARKFKGSADVFAAVDKYLEQREGKWGFNTDADGAPVLMILVDETREEAELQEMQASAAAFKPTPEMHAEMMAIVAKAHPEAFKELTEQGVIKSSFPTTTFGVAPAPKADAELDKALHQHHEDGSDVVEADPAPDAFSAFAHAQLTARPQPTSTVPAARANPDRPVEKNREEANGVKRPSSGTLCAQVWDIATQLSNGDEKPSTKVAKLSEVVKAATDKGINQFTARTQYARWRVFHGIVGRNT